jgi:hypothetical protein
MSPLSTVSLRRKVHKLVRTLKEKLSKPYEKGSRQKKHKHTDRESLLRQSSHRGYKSRA